VPLFLIKKALDKLITVGQFSFYYNSTFRFTADFNALSGIAIELYDNSIGVKAVREIFEAENVIKDGDRKLKVDSNPPKIEFRNVSFKYPSEKKYVLKDINLTINPKDEIAFVGENGAGKTTLIKLLSRFYLPTSGEILIDGIPIQDLTISSYYDKISILFQDFNIYGPHTVKNNITLGENEKSVEEAAEQAEVLGDIKDLEKGFDSILSKWFTDGVDLSKGQKQKISIARAFYSDRPILILDEPTASIDAVAEHRIFKRIYQFMENKTVIIISHRFSTVRNAQKIYVLDKGRIVEQGSHEELLKINGKYKEAFDLQKEGYN
jgi:ABC-type multidrug transport system fused ATPase/permease subunit